MSLFSANPRRVWTTNYDDLLEEAARLVEPHVRSIEPGRRLAAGDLSIAHVHGFLPAQGRIPQDFILELAQIILAEDDYHLISSSTISWTNRELYRLFDEHRVLILGMSLADPNIRRVLASVEPGDMSEPRHWAVLPASDAQDIRLHRVRQSSLPRFSADMDQFRSLYWRDHGVKIVVLPDHRSMLPFLVRLRYESYGAAPGDLWKKGVELGYEAIDPWRPDRQQAAKQILDAAVGELRRDFAVLDGAEVVELGILLLQPDYRTLELTFRGGTDVQAVQGARLLSADPDVPQGVAGRGFVSGDLVRIPRNHPLHDFGLEKNAARSSSPNYEGIISAPIINWREGWIPIGVIYLTTSRTDGVLFGLPDTNSKMARGQSVQDLYDWLMELAMLVLSSGNS